MDKQLEITLSGELIHIGDTQTFESGFCKRGAAVKVIDGNPDYPQEIGIEFVKDRVSQLDQFRVGQQVTVKCNLRGNEYNGKYYVNLTAWRIDGAQGAPSAPARQQAAAPLNEPEDDVLPF